MSKLESMSNDNYLIELQGKKYVLRIPGRGTSELINREQEYNVYETIKSLGISDPLVFIDKESGVKITEYIDNARNCNIDSNNDIIVCFRLLHILHESGLRVKHEFNLKEKISYYENLVYKARDDGEFSRYHDYAAVKSRVYKCLDTVAKYNVPQVLCHLDSVYANFLITSKKAYLIDWEYAGMCDPLVDIAAFIVYSNIGHKRAKQLLEIYLQQIPTQQELVRFYTMIAALGLTWSNWCEYKNTQGQYYGEYEQWQYDFAKDYSLLALKVIEK